MYDWRPLGKSSKGESCIDLREKCIRCNRVSVFLDIIRTLVNPECMMWCMRSCPPFMAVKIRYCMVCNPVHIVKEDSGYVFKD